MVTVECCNEGLQRRDARAQDTKELSVAMLHAKEQVG